MSLTLDEVKNARFPLCMRPRDGYRAAEVDAFMDRLDASYTELTQENERLKAQLKGLDAGEGTATTAPADDSLRSENEELKKQVQQLTAERDQLKTEHEQLKQQASQPVPAPAASQPSADPAELDRLRAENASLRDQLTQAQQRPVNAAESDHLVVTTSADASPAVTRLVQLATDQADAVVAEANAKAEQLRSEAQADADRVRNEAQAHADQVRSQADADAGRMRSEAQQHLDQVNSQADEHRRALFTNLEHERDALRGRVEHLRTFEATYRENLSNHLQSQLDAVRSGHAEPADKPELLSETSQGQDASVASAGQSQTPRLDALLAEGTAKN